MGKFWDIEAVEITNKLKKSVESYWYIGKKSRKEGNCLNICWDFFF